MKKIYIAGPYRGESAWEIEENIRIAEQAILPIARAGGNPFCPHSMFRYMQGAMPDAFWLTGTLAWLEVCDCLYLGPGWERSAGSRAEMERATDLNMPVFTSMTALTWWLMSNKE